MRELENKVCQRKSDQRNANEVGLTHRFDLTRTTFVGLPPPSRRRVSEPPVFETAVAASAAVIPAAPPKNAAVLVGGDDGGRRSPVPVAVVRPAEPLQFGRVLPGHRISLN